MFTVGHSTNTLDDLVALCRGAGIETICDVRRFPRSRRHPHFAREHLERALPERNMGYVWLGETLGGMREGSYEDWMATAEFARGLDELEKLATESVVAFMCAEGDPAKCHRRFVARVLAERGHEVSHLLPDGRIVFQAPPLSLPDP
jgi:uncharacterized protein (DUF488 family)